MRRRMFQLAVLAMAEILFLSGCVYSHRGGVVREPATVTYPAGEVVVSEPPPPPRVERYGPAPDERHVWVAGYWARMNDRWVWIPGHWENRPRPAAIWIPGHWDKNLNSRGWTWTPGHWE